MAQAETDEEKPKGGLGQEGCNKCGLPEAEVLVVRNQNLDYPWQGGNKFMRICPDCGSQKFTAKSYWQVRLANPDAKAHVIRKGEEEPVEAVPCPHDDCDPDGDSGFVAVDGEECLICKQHATVEDGEALAVYDCPYEDCDGLLVESETEECPECEGTIEWED